MTELALDGVQLGLDLGGIVDPTPITDGASALISVGRGDWWGAGISVLGMAPYVGDLAKLGKLGRYGKSVTKIIELAKNNAKVAETFRPMLAKIYDLLRNAPLDKLPASIAKPLRKMRDEIGEFLGNAPNKNRWSYITDWHDKRATELFGPGSGRNNIGGRNYDKRFAGRDIEFKSDNFSKGPRAQDSLDRMNTQIGKDIENLNNGVANPHWHFDHDPSVAPEMAPLLKRLDDAGIPWTWGKSTPSF